MHEFSLALEVVDIVERTALQNKANKVRKVKLDVGTISGVVIEALKFALESAKKNSTMEQSNIEINVIQALAKCDECGNEFELEHIFDLCPKCSSYQKKIIKGKEFKVSSIEIDN